MSLFFALNGPALKAGMPFHLISKVFGDIQSVFDKTYLTLSNQEKITKKTRSQFQLVSHGVKHDSILSDLEIGMGLIQVGMPLFTSFSTTDIWDYTKNTFDFLKLIYAESKNGNRPSIQVHDNNNCEVQVGDRRNIFNGPVYMIGTRAISDWQDLTKILEAGKVDSLQVGGKNTPGISLTAEHRNLFDAPSRLDERPTLLACNIRSFDKVTNKGKLIVERGEFIPEGEYNFTVSGSQENQKYIQSMLKPKVIARCLIEEVYDPLLNTSKVSLIHVLDIVAGTGTTEKQLILT